MYKIAAIIGGVLLMAGVALAGTVSSLGSPSSPTIGQTIPTAALTVRQEDRGVEQQAGDDPGQEAEARGRANEAGEDVRGPCDEAEHANDPRCTGAAATPAAGDDDVSDRSDDNSGRGSSNSGPGSSSSGHDGGEDDDSGSGHGGESGHGGHGGDD
jgi:hypothetical protein